MEQYTNDEDFILNQGDRDTLDSLVPSYMTEFSAYNEYVTKQGLLIKWDEQFKKLEFDLWNNASQDEGNIEDVNENLKLLILDDGIYNPNIMGYEHRQLVMAKDQRKPG